jgi:AraC-like DNA-binding protein
MLTLETALRLMVIGQELLVAAVFLAGAGSRRVRAGGAFLMLGVVAYLYASDPALSGSLPFLEPLAILLALTVPFALWLFAHAVFESAAARPVVAYATLVIVLAVWGIYLAADAIAPAVRVAAGILIRAWSLLIVGHALWLTLQGRPDDLVEGRRLLRLFFVGIISLQVAVVLVIEMILGEVPAPAWLDLTNVVVIALMTIGLAVPMLRLNRDFFDSGTAAESAGVPADEGAPGGAEGVYHRKLLQLMDAGTYRETGLTIPVLAAKIDYPEHRLRRLINGRLGYRNFSAFLNSYRIEAAKRELADPDKVRVPVLTIALDLGYGSLGPFNRAFKAGTGLTPTEFRRQELGNKLADSG